MKKEELLAIAQDARQAWHYTDCEYAGPTLEGIYKAIEPSLQQCESLNDSIKQVQALEDVISFVESDPLHFESLKPTLKKLLFTIEKNTKTNKNHV